MSDSRNRSIIESKTVVFSVTTDELLGREDRQAAARSAASGFVAAVKKIESIPKRDQKALLHYLDALIQKNTATG